MYDYKYQANTEFLQIYTAISLISGLVQRCVILHRDENGYGLTVSGDNPVYVQSVKESKTSFYLCQLSVFNIQVIDAKAFANLTYASLILPVDDAHVYSRNSEKYRAI